MADKKISALPAASTPLAGTEVLPIVQGGTTDKVSVANLTAGRTVSTGNLNVSGEQTITGAVRSVLKMYGDFAGGTDVGKIQFYNAVDEFLGQININNTTGAAGDTSTMDLWVSSAGTPKQAIVFEPTQNVRLPAGNLVLSTAGKGIDFSANANAPGMTSELLTWYEEGVFTLTDSGVKDAVLGTWTFVSGTYTRIGRQVTINATFSGTGLGFSANTGYYRWDGLPFASAATHSGTWQGIEAFKACAGFAFTAGSNIWIHAAITTQTSDSGIVLTATYTV